MITNKDIRVENGSLILNGDPYPLDGQSPETIMEIVEDNSDSTPTENSDAPITSGGVFTALGTKQDSLTFDNTPTDASTNPVTSAGVYIALAGKQDLLVNISGTLPNSVAPLTIPYPTGVTKNDYSVIGWNIISNNIKYSGFNMGGSSSVRLLQIAMLDNGVQVTNDESAFFEKAIEIILAKV